MEHVINDYLFLEKCKSWLKPGGIIVLEVPLLMKYPFSESAEPYGHYHIREYEVGALQSLFSEHFKIIDSYGVSRGFYTHIENSRNATLLVGRKQN